MSLNMSNNSNQEVGKTINLKKGEKINLTKGTTLKHALVGLGWDTNKYSGSFDFDLDASVFLVGQNGRVNRDEDFIFYNNLASRNQAVVHQGDNRTGDGDGDDEVITIDFSKIPADIERIAITVTIYDAKERNQNFGQVTNAFIRLVDSDTGKEVLRFDLGEEFSVETAIVAAEIYRYNGEWKFDAVGSGFDGGLESLCKNYGLNV